jgi:hypothetical protein
VLLYQCENDLGSNTSDLNQDQHKRIWTRRGKNKSQQNTHEKTRRFDLPEFGSKRTYISVEASQGTGSLPTLSSDSRDQT